MQMTSRSNAMKLVATSNQPYVKASQFPEYSHHFEKLARMGKLIDVGPGVYALPANAVSAKKQFLEQANHFAAVSNSTSVPTQPDYEDAILARQEHLMAY